jgi:hypothetical protein
MNSITKGQIFYADSDFFYLYLQVYDFLIPGCTVLAGWLIKPTSDVLFLANPSYERAFGACSANQEMHIATQNNIYAANQNAAERSITSVQPIWCENIKQWRRDRTRSDALVFRAAPASILEYRLESLALVGLFDAATWLPSSTSPMPPFGF